MRERLCHHGRPFSCLECEQDYYDDIGECPGCGCSRWACDGYRTSGKACCPDCVHGRPPRPRMEKAGPNWTYTNEHGDRFRLVSTGDRVIPFVIEREGV